MDYYTIVDTLLGKMKDKKTKKLIAENYENFIENSIKTSNIYSKISKLLKQNEGNLNHLIRKIHEIPIGTKDGKNLYFDNNQSFILSRILQLKPINIKNLQLSKTEKDIIKKYNVIIKDLHYQLLELKEEYSQKGGVNHEENENISWTETIVEIPKYTLLKTAGFLEQLATIGDTDFSKLNDFKEPLSFIYIILFLMAQIPFVGGFADFAIIVKALLDQRIFLAIITSLTFLLSMIVFHIVDFGMLFKVFYTMDVTSHTRYTKETRPKKEEETDSQISDNSWFKMFSKKTIEPKLEEKPDEEQEEKMKEEPVISEGSSEITEPTSEELKLKEPTDEPIIETKDEQKEEPLLETKDELKEEPLVETKDELKEEPIVETKKELTEEPKVETKKKLTEEIKDETKEEQAKDELEDETKEQQSKDELKKEIKDVSKEEQPKDEPKDETKEIEVKLEKPKEEIQLEIKSLKEENEPQKLTAISKMAEKPTTQTGGNVDTLVGNQGAGEKIIVEKIDNRKKLGGNSNFKIVREENRIRIIKMEKFDKDKKPDDISTFSK